MSSLSASRTANESARGPDTIRPVASWVTVALLVVFMAVSLNLVVVPVFAEYYDGRRILQIAFSAAVVAVLVASRSLRDDVLEISTQVAWPVRVAVGAIALLGVVSAARSPIPAAGFREIALLGLVVLLTVTVAAVRNRLEARFDLAVLATLAAATLAYTVFFVVLRWAQISLLGFESLTVRPWLQFYGWSNARFFGQVAVWTLPLLIAAPLLLSDRTRLTRAMCFIAAVVLWALMIEAAGRGSILVIVAALVAVMILLGRSARRWSRHAVAILGIGTAVWYAVSWGLSDLSGAGRSISPGVDRAIAKGGSDNLRFSFWQEAVEMVAARPLLGVGPEHYAYYQRAYTAAHPHNAPLQLAAEWGVPVAISVTALVVWGFVRWIGKWRAEPDGPQATLVTALTASVVAAGVLSMVDGVLMAPGSQMMLAIVVGWMLALYVGATQPAASRTRQAWTHAGVGLVSMALVGVLVWSAGPYLFSPHETFQRQIEHLQPEKVTPRFWLQGRLYEE